MITFGSLVKVIMGFYIGCHGMVVSRVVTGYAVNLYCTDAQGIPVYLNETSMQPNELRVITKEEWEQMQ